MEGSPLSALSTAAPAEPQIVTSPPSALVTAAAWSWRLLIVGAAIVATVLALARLKLVVLPLIAAAMLATALRPPARFLERRGLPKGVATLVTFLGFIALLGGISVLAAQPLVDEITQLGPTLSRSFDDIQHWLVDGPLQLEPAQVEELRMRAGESLRLAAPGLIAPAIALVEVIAGLLLAVVMAFLLVKDGAAFEEAALRRLPPAQRDRFYQAGRAARRALEGYLRGAAAVGVIEGTIIGMAVVLVGGRLAIPVALLTFAAAFVPVLGAVVSGVVATLVTLVTAGPREAVIIAIVALVVQQLDNDLLSPLVYGRTVRLHPLAILLSIATGATLAGITGTFLAVPVCAITVAVAGALRTEPVYAVEAPGT